MKETLRRNGQRWRGKPGENGSLRRECQEGGGKQMSKATDE